MKKSELRKLIRETIKEQFQPPSMYFSGWTEACTPGPNCVEPTLQAIEGALGDDINFLRLKCPSGFRFQNEASPSFNMYTSNPPAGFMAPISYCVPAVSGVGDVCEDFNQLSPEQQQQLCLAYNNLTTSNPSLEAIGENCCNNVIPNVPSQGEGTGSMSVTGSMASMPQLKPQNRQR